MFLAAKSHDGPEFEKLRQSLCQDSRGFETIVVNLVMFETPARTSPSLEDAAVRRRRDVM
jgi:hypothetical protein